MKLLSEPPTPDERGSAMTDLKSLREIAEKATPGPWGPNMPNDFEIEWPDSVYDAIHIGSFNPAAALALIDRIEALQKAVEVARKDLTVIRDKSITRLEIQYVARNTLIQLDALEKGSE